MAIRRPADARPVAAHAFRGFNGLIGREVVAWRPGFVEMSLKVRPELCNANGLHRSLKGERRDGMLAFLDHKAAD
jgi:hypothetical protein